MILVGAPVVSGVLFMAGISVYLALDPVEYEILPIEGIYAGVLAVLAVVPTLIGVFLIRQIQVARGAWSPIVIQWRRIGGQVTSYSQRIRWVFVAGHFLIWLVLAGMAIFLFSRTPDVPMINIIVGGALLVMASTFTAGLVSYHLKVYSLWFASTPIMVLAGLSVIGMAVTLIVQEGRDGFLPLIFGGMLVCAIGLVFPLIALGEFRWRRVLILVVALVGLFTFGFSTLSSGLGWVFFCLFWGGEEAGAGEPFLIGIPLALAITATLAGLLIIQQVTAARGKVW